MKRVLFALKNDWIEPVRERLDPARYEPSFRNFRQRPQFAHFDCIVPLHLNDYPPLWRYRWRAEFLIPSQQIVSLTDDKPRFMEFLGGNGFAEFAPEVYRDNVAYPFIYKKRIDIAGKNSHVIASAKDRAKFESGIANEEYFKQEYVGGRTEYTTHLLAMKGESTFDSTMAFTFDRDAYVRGVRCEPAETRKVETPFVDVFQAILKALNYSGTACFNYKIAAGVPKIFELNARAGGSLRLDLNAYVDAYIAALEARHTFVSLWVHRLRRRFIHLSPPRHGRPAVSPPAQTQPA